ncbi:hypothetical protein [Acinetobacter guillouiae]|uniref:hypothetical protein n=1 Tax=Acinetobacter guillouiae TaxID=106649 RepID=UPI003AF74293
MATDVQVQFFSHLNGLVLGNNWGDMVRLLDSCLVNGLPLSSVTSASINNQGDITLNLYADHKSLLFQIVELSGFEPTEINGKYRIKGTPTTTQLILKANHAGKTVTKIGTAKLASLGYDIIFRDGGDVKRVYRAKNHRTEHPFIRVDETISDGVNSYTSTYAKSAMVGLLENMTHIDDYHDTTKMQLPLDISDLRKNWKINGTGSGVVRGWSRWYWNRSNQFFGNAADSDGGNPDSSKFTLCGDFDAFYMLNGIYTDNHRLLYGCGIFESSLDNSVIPSWFLMSSLTQNAAWVSYQQNQLPGGISLTYSENDRGVFFTTRYSLNNDLNNHTTLRGITPDDLSGYSGIYNANNISALEIPLVDAEKFLRGSLKHILYSGNNTATIATTVKISDASMYVQDFKTLISSNNVFNGSLYFYLGELE